MDAKTLQNYVRNLSRVLTLCPQNLIKACKFNANVTESKTLPQNSMTEFGIVTC